jgi:hypothetical protein
MQLVNTAAAVLGAFRYARRSHAADALLGQADAHGDHAFRDVRALESPTREITRRPLTRPRIRRAARRQSCFLTAEWNKELGVKDLTWLTPSSKEMTLDHWRLAGKVHWDAARQVSGIPGRGGEGTLLLVVNAHHDSRDVQTTGSGGWTRLVPLSRHNFARRGMTSSMTGALSFGDEYDVTACSLLLFLAAV